MISRADDGSEATSTRRRRRPSALPRRRVLLGFALAAVALPRPHVGADEPPRAPRPAERAPALPPPRRRGLRGRRRLAGARRGCRAASCSSTGTSRLRSTRSRSPRARTSWRSPSSSRSRRSSAPSSRSRRDAPPTAPATAPRRRRWRSWPGRGPSPTAGQPAADCSALDAVAVYHRTAGEWALEHSAGPAPASASPDDANASRARRAPPAPDGRRGRHSRAPTTASWTRSPGRSQPRSRSTSSGWRRRPPRTSPPPETCAQRSSPPSRTTSARRSRASRRR